MGQDDAKAAIARLVRRSQRRPAADAVTLVNEARAARRSQVRSAAAADDTERWLNSLDPAAIASPDADASHLRRLGAAVRSAAASQTELSEAVAAAREHGHSWAQIATMLGTSRQAAQERYGETANRS